MKFNVRDIDRERLKQRAFTEAQYIFDKDSTRRDRTLHEVRINCLIGHAAELYLIDYCGFKDDPTPYKDVFDPSDNPTEVKVIRNAKDVYFVLKRAKEYMLEDWRKYPKLLYIFVVNEYSGDYVLHGIYNWNGKEFV